MRSPDCRYRNRCPIMDIAFVAVGGIDENQPLLAELAAVALVFMAAAGGRSP